MQRNSQTIAYWAEDLKRLAHNLDLDLSSWDALDTSSPAANQEQQRRGNILWLHAKRAGLVFFKLCGLGAFDQFPQLKKHICQVRAELKQCLDVFEVPPFYFVLKAPYHPPTTDDGFDVFFVNIFEGFCRLQASSYEDQCLLNRHTDYLSRGRLYVRLMIAAGESIKSKFSQTRV